MLVSTMVLPVTHELVRAVKKAVIRDVLFPSIVANGRSRSSVPMIVNPKKTHATVRNVPAD